MLYANNSAHKPRRGKLSPFTVKTRFMAVRRLFSFLEQEGHLDHNPTRRIKTPDPKRKEPKGVSAEDVKALLATCEGDTLADRRDKAIVLFLCDTGCRVGGLCGLKVGDLDLDQGLATVTEKGRKTRYVMFTPTTAKALRAWLSVRPDGDPGVFVGLGNKSKGALKPNGVATMLARRSKRAGCTGPTNPHAFRHAFARHFLLHGGDIGPLADILGHESVETTKRFYGIFTLGELQTMHEKFSPVADMFGNGV
jgi:site-specific recombinase XerD